MDGVTTEANLYACRLQADVSRRHGAVPELPQRSGTSYLTGTRTSIDALQVISKRAAADAQ